MDFRPTGSASEVVVIACTIKQDGTAEQNKFSDCSILALVVLVLFA